MSSSFALLAVATHCVHRKQTLLKQSYFLLIKERKAHSDNMLPGESDNPAGKEWENTP